MRTTGIKAAPSSSSKRLGSRRSLRSSTRSNIQYGAGAGASCNARAYMYAQLAAATGNFRADCLLGEGGFGPVDRGRLEDGQLVAVKQLDLNGVQGNREFVVEVLMLSLLHHDNLVSLTGSSGFWCTSTWRWGHSPTTCCCWTSTSTARPLGLGWA